MSLMRRIWFTAPPSAVEFSWLACDTIAYVLFDLGAPGSQSSVKMLSVLYYPNLPFSAPNIPAALQALRSTKYKTINSLRHIKGRFF